jgi:hypothetical protein
VVFALIGASLADVKAVARGDGEAEKIEIIRVRPVLTDTQDRFMLIDRQNANGNQLKILKTRPVYIVPISTPDRFMLIGRDERLSQRP